MSFFNYLSLVLGGIEVFLFPMITRGFPMVQFIFEEEKLFMNEKCSKEDIINGVYCEEAKAVFGDIYSSMLLAINGGSFFFGFLYLKIGGAFLRLIMGVLMTAGLFCISFYKTSPYFFFAGMILSSTGVIMWIPLNTMIGPIFKKNSSYVVLFLSALVVASGATFWYGKLAYQSGYPLDSYIFIIAILSIMITIRTLFLFPLETIPKDVPDDFCMFKSSLVGRVLNRKRVGAQKEAQNVQAPTWRQYLPYIFHPINIALSIWDISGFFRSYTFIGWMVPWLNHGFDSHVIDCQGNITCQENIHSLKSQTMDSLGYLQILSPLLPILMMLKLKWSVNRYPKSYPLPQLRENLNTLVSRAIIITVLAIAMTIFQWFPIPVASSGYSTLALVLWILHLTFMNSWYILFLYQFCPAQMVPVMFAVKFIMFPIYYINTPLYSSIIAENDSEIDFTVSSCVLLAIVIATSSAQIYFYFFSRRFLKAKERTFLYFPNPSGWKERERTIFQRIIDMFTGSQN